MIISCPECETKFSVADTVLGDRGRKVRCFKCGHTWHQMPETATSGMPPMAAEPMAVDAPPRAPKRPTAPLMPPTSTVAGVADDMPLESEPAFAAPPPPAPAPVASDLPMDSDLPRGRELPDDFEIPEIVPSADPDALAGTPSADDVGSLNPVDVDALLGSKAEDLPQVFARQIAAEEKKRSAFGRLVMWLVILAGIAAMLWFGRMQIVDRFPQAAQIYKSLGVPIEILGDGLEFRGVSSEMVKEGRTPVLQVRGVIANVTDRERPVPLLRLVLLDTNGGVIQQAFGQPRKDSLAGGAQIGFQIRLENPSAAAVRYEVTFAAAPSSGETPEKPAADAAAKPVNGPTAPPADIPAMKPADPAAAKPAGK